MGKVLVIRKAEATSAVSGGGGGGVGVGLGGGGLMFMLGGGGSMAPDSKKFIDMFGEIGSESHDRAVAMQKLGRRMRYGAAGLGAFNALYNQTSSGQPGIGSAMATGAMGGYAGSAGAEDWFARNAEKQAQARNWFGGKLSRTALAPPTPDEKLDAAAREAFAAPIEPAMDSLNNASGNMYTGQQETPDQIRDRDTRRFDFS